MAEDFQVASIPFLQNRDRFVAPRVQIVGKVIYKATESDGDQHVILAPEYVDNSIDTLTKLRDQGVDYVVCEIIPELPMPNGLPVLHSMIMARGIYRWDAEHGWPELHPLLSWLDA